MQAAMVFGRIYTSKAVKGLRLFRRLEIAQIKIYKIFWCIIIIIIVFVLYISRLFQMKLIMHKKCHIVEIQID